MNPAVPPARGRQDAFLFLCFFASGFAALIYQTAWTREFAFVFGTSELAIATVLAAYMGGLAGGAAVAARFAHRIKRPVLTYALLELGIAGAALLVPTGIAGARVLYAFLFASSGAPPAVGGLGTALFYLACSFLILLIPTGLMGATLPLLSRHAVKTSEEIGSRIGSLYAINTAGAVLGTVLTGFVILPALGLRGTLGVAIACNALVFATAALLARSSPPVERFAKKEAQARPTGNRRFILPLILVSGSVSFYYEVLWSRLLGHILGGSLYSFATMLGTFLAGIAIGAAVAARRAKDAETSARGFAWAQIGTAVLSWGAFAVLDRIPAWFNAMGDVAGPALLADAAVAAIILLPGTVCIGATFPYAIRIYASNLASAPTASARVYTWNTVGAILGAIGAGFFLIPAVGYSTSLVMAVATNFGLAAAAATLLSKRSRSIAVPALVGVIALGLLPPSPPWLLLRNMPHLGSTGSDGAITDFRVGRSATVMLRESRGSWLLSTNGLPEALILAPGSHPGTLIVGQWLGAAGVLARPNARSALVIGLGGGTLIEHIPESVFEIDVIEIEPEVVRANRSIGDRRRVDPLAQERVTLTINDARSALALTKKRYDLVISQPSHPWTVAASNLYTREFFEEVRRHLSDDGVLIQWMGLAFVDTFLVKSLVATLLEVFPHVRVYQPGLGAIVLLASPAPLDVESGAAKAIAQDPDSFATLGIFAPEDLAATLVLDEAASRRFAVGSAINQDDKNFLQARSPMLMRGQQTAVDREELFAPFEPLARIRPDWNALYLVRKTGALGFKDRAERLANSISDPADRAIGLGLAEYARARFSLAVPLLKQGLALRPNSDEARIALIRLHYAGQGDRSLEIEELRSGLRGEGTQALVSAWQAERENDWETLRELEPQLARVAPVDPGYGDASRLRALWRVETGSPERAQEALVLIDTMGPLMGGPEVLLLRARAAAAAGHTRGAIHTLFRLGSRLRLIERHQELASEALRFTASLPRSPENRDQMGRLVASLSRFAD